MPMFPHACCRRIEIAFVADALHVHLFCTLPPFGRRDVLESRTKAGVVIVGERFCDQGSHPLHLGARSACNREFRISSFVFFATLFFQYLRGSMKSVRLLLFLLTPMLAAAQSTHIDHPILPIGSPAPDFSLPGVDGKTHSLSDYASSSVLAVIFACNHCPISQMYEQRIQQLYNNYTPKGVAIVVIQPNDPKALRID